MIQREWLYEISGEENSERDYHSFWGNSLKEVEEMLLSDTFEKINEIYIPGLYQWIEDNEQELLNGLLDIEDHINMTIVNDNQVEIYKHSLESFNDWHLKAIAAFNAKSKTGGITTMGITIEAEELVEPGVYEATIASIDSIEGKYGERLQVTFDLEDERQVNGFFAPKATPNNKTGMLFEKALGELRTADSDELIGKTVKILIEHKQSDGRTYVNVSKIL